MFASLPPSLKYSLFPLLKELKRWKGVKFNKDNQDLIFEVPCLDIVKKYNSYMGGVDPFNMLIYFHRTPFCFRRWYLAIFSKVVDMYAPGLCTEKTVKRQT